MSEPTPRVAMDCHRPFSLGLEGVLRPTPTEPALLTEPAAFHPADTELEWFDTPRLQVRSVSTRGHSHRYEQRVRQDAMAHSSNDGWVCAAVADGLGSEPMSHVGAKVAATAATSEVGQQQLLRAQGRTVAFDFIQRALVGAAADGGRDASDYRTTLSAAMVTGDGGYPLQAVVAQLGDSDVWHVRGAEGRRVFPPEARGAAYASSGVLPLPDETQARLAAIELEPGDLLLLTTDGVSNLLMGEPAYLRALLGLFSDGAPTAAALLAYVDASVASYDDDRTLVGMRAVP